MSKRRGNFLLLGALIGFIAGLFLAPKKGSELRRDARNKIDEIKENNYVLTPGRYVGTEKQEDDGVPFEEKMKKLTTELKAQFEESHKIEEEIKKNLDAILNGN